MIVRTANLRTLLCAVLLGTPACALAQNPALPSAPQPQTSLPQAPMTSAHGSSTGQTRAREVAAPLRPYGACTNPAGTTLIAATPLPEAPLTRTADTITGSRPIKLLDGVGAAFGFPQGAFVNAKFELLPAGNYGGEKSDLIGEWDKIRYAGNSEETERNLTLKPSMNGFAIQGFDKKTLTGGILGIYLLFDDAHHVVTTLYFLNQDDAHRNFKNMAEYRQLRDRFIWDLTSCVRTRLDAEKSRPATSPKH